MSRYYTRAREIFERAYHDGIVVMQRDGNIVREWVPASRGLARAMLRVILAGRRDRVALKRAIQRESAWAYRAPREELVEEARELRVYRSRVDSDYRIAQYVYARYTEILRNLVYILDEEG